MVLREGRLSWAMATAAINVSGHQNGFTEKLRDELPLVRSDHFAHPHLTGAHSGPGCGKVDEIDAGHQKHKDPDHGKGVHDDDIVFAQVQAS